ncbi:hypothetical protein [Roseofilum casamattae]|uniref:Uncharacterized protein n=1 Tax=Roseofilum casamattae BLCC-M143 TaxID=3022442 RepID=A0ABT7C427_9CYAN|nr:hypothetical protein [Roseofilum casamattae]MDJ1185629.1 hypothetical protein [Roseofilum casamattae BLCC-M143]
MTWFSHLKFSIVLLEQIKQKLDQFNDVQLDRVAHLIEAIEAEGHGFTGKTQPLWCKKTSTERAEEFDRWVAQLPRTNISLPDEAFNRDNLYRE